MLYTLCAATPFVGEGLIPFERIGPAEKRIDIFNFTGERMIHFSGNGGVVLNSLDNVTLMRAVIKMETGQTGSGTFMRQQWKKQDFVGEGELHPQK